MANWMKLAGFIVVLQMLAFLTSYFVTEQAVSTWYQGIAKSPLTPPDWVFAPVWMTLYVMIGIAGWLLWPYRHTPIGRTALILFILQLVLNYLWSPIFFGLAAFIAALWLIVAIDFVLAATIITAWPLTQPAAILLLPYFIWAMFATHLTWYVALNN